MRFCNCSVGFFFPAKNYPECNISGLMCMSPHNDFVNALKPLKKNEFFDENEEGMICDCLPECSRIDYGLVINPIYDEKQVDPNYVLIDVHYEVPTMMKYRTDVAFSEMDLLVGFGGIVSLFLGVSVLSGAEIIYFSTVAMFWHRQRSRVTQAEVIRKIQTKIPFLN